MPESTIETLFVDTSSLRRTGFQHPDLQKLLKRSKERVLELLISKIAWEEYRTTIRDKICEDVRGVRTSFERLAETALTHPVMRRLPLPVQFVWDEEAVDTATLEYMRELEAEHRIIVIPTGADHGDRVLDSYFKSGPPFNTKKSRENRRKDFPDAWIVRAAEDLRAEGRRFAALCHDENLAASLAGLGIQVFREVADVIQEMERSEIEQEEPSSEPITT